MPTNIVEAHGITKTFGKTQVLKGVDLTVLEGTVLALLGPNGAGKPVTGLWHSLRTPRRRLARGRAPDPRLRRGSGAAG